jgi:DNA-binding GntR family transcriptional regulator
LTILVDSAARSYEVRLLLEAGLKELLTEAGTEANLKRIRIRVGKVS